MVRVDPYLPYARTHATPYMTHGRVLVTHTNSGPQASRSGVSGRWPGVSGHNLTRVADATDAAAMVQVKIYHGNTRSSHRDGGVDDGDFVHHAQTLGQQEGLRGGGAHALVARPRQPDGGGLP